MRIAPCTDRTARTRERNFLVRIAPAERILVFSEVHNICIDVIKLSNYVFIAEQVHYSDWHYANSMSVHKVAHLTANIIRRSYSAEWA